VLVGFIFAFFGELPFKDFPDLLYCVRLFRALVVSYAAYTGKPLKALTKKCVIGFVLCERGALQSVRLKSALEFCFDFFDFLLQLLDFLGVS
jgi:hypothetical protein